MAKDLFNTLDLNLLRTFLIVYQELNTRKAAERLFVSQPAVSQALQKLRHHFSDDLFVKVHGGLQPTSFCESLANAITPHLDGLSFAINQRESFSPKDIDYPIKIALSPIVLTCLSGTLFKKIKDQAPNAQLELLAWSPTTLEDIEKGTTLLGVNYHVEQASQAIDENHLIDLVGRLFVRQSHPITGKAIEPRELSGYEMASLITPGWNDHFSYAGLVLDKLGVDYSIGFRSELVMAIIDVVEHTDMYMPHSNLFPIENYPKLRAVDVFVDGKPYRYPIYSHTHSKHKNSLMVKWLASTIKSALEEQSDKVSLLDS